MGMYHYHMESDVKISKENLVAFDHKFGKSVFALAEEQDYKIYLYGDENGIENIEFEESKRWENSFFENISPFVEDGSYIQIMFEHESVFRLMYKGGKMYHISPKWEISE